MRPPPRPHPKPERRAGAPRPTGAAPPRLAWEAAEAVALEALGFLASDPERAERFLSLAGIGVADLRAAAARPGFLLGVLDHLAGDEALLLAFAEATGSDPLRAMAARRALGGPEALGSAEAGG